MKRLSSGSLILSDLMNKQRNTFIRGVCISVRMNYDSLLNFQEHEGFFSLGQCKEDYGIDYLFSICDLSCGR
jgi:hypothetical protein